MNLTFWIASRLNLKSESKGQRSPGVTIAVAGVAISITVMLIAIAVVMGFKNNIKEKLLGLESAIVIAPAEQKTETHNTFVPTSGLMDAVRNTLPEGARISESLQTTALIKTEDDFLGITLRANEPGSDQEDYIRENITEGEYPDYNLPDNKESIVLSEPTARLLDLKTGDKIRLHFFDGNAVRTRSAKVAAIYNTSFSERDRLLAFASAQLIESAQKLPEGSASSINVSGIPSDRIDELTSSLQETLLVNMYDSQTDHLLVAQSIRQRAAMYYNWLDLLDTNVVVIIILMGLVASFTLISCLLIIILERIRFIGIMKAMGATTVAIQKIFVSMALKIVVFGLLAGNVTGLTILLVQQHFRIIPLNPEAYFLDSVPVEIIPWQMIALNAGAVIISAAVLIIPTTIISTISPATTIKYE